MPITSPKPCTVCRKLVHDGSARCDEHKVRPGSFADSRRGSRHDRGYGSRWDRTREAIKTRASGLCEPCRAAGFVHEGHHCDHVISKGEWLRLHGSLVGVDAPSNLQWLNRDCHAQKTVIDRMRASGADVPRWQPAAPITAVLPDHAEARHG
ncbi:MAG: HNH endonuclease [Rubrivivax sp.]|nr:MAG: HNH endonuclease [Rubrivivax sp.]